MTSEQLQLETVSFFRKHQSYNRIAVKKSKLFEVFICGESVGEFSKLKLATEWIKEHTFEVEKVIIVKSIVVNGKQQFKSKWEVK